MNESSILHAIHDDDLKAVKELLRITPSLSTLQISKPRLYQTKILHWIYAGDTPLHLAAAGHRTKIVELLLSAGADPNSSLNHRRSCPLHYAADSCPNRPTWNPHRQVETIRVLLEAGASIDAQDKNGATPLHRAVRTRGAEAVRCLLEAGCNPALKNKPGSTAFHLAVQNTGRGGSGSDAAKAAQRQIIEDFLAFGLSINLKDGQRNSVFDCARSEWIRALLRATP